MAVSSSTVYTAVYTRFDWNNPRVQHYFPLNTKKDSHAGPGYNTGSSTVGTKNQGVFGKDRYSDWKSDVPGPGTYF